MYYLQKNTYSIDGSATGVQVMKTCLIVFKEYIGMFKNTAISIGRTLPIEQILSPMPYLRFWGSIYSKSTVHSIHWYCSMFYVYKIYVRAVRIYNFAVVWINFMLHTSAMILQIEHFSRSFELPLCYLGCPLIYYVIKVIWSM